MVEAAKGNGEWSELNPSLRNKFSEHAITFYRSLLQEQSADASLQYETAVGYRSLGSLYIARKDYQQAEALLRKSIGILARLCDEHPATFSYRNQLGWSHYELFAALRSQGSGEAPAVLEKAIALYQQFLREDPNVRDYVAPLGLCYERLLCLKRSQGKPVGDLLDMLISARREWVRLSPNELKATVTLARTLAFNSEGDRQKLEEAVKVAQKSVELAPLDSLSWNTLGVTNYCAGNHRDAVRALLKSSEFNNDRPSNFLYLAMAEWQLGNHDAAREWHQKAIKRLERRPQIKAGELYDLRAESEELLGILEPANPAARTSTKKANDRSLTSDQ